MNFTPKSRQIRMFALLSVIGLVALAAPAAAQPPTKAAKQSRVASRNDAQSILASADFYYNNNDITGDRAATLYRQARDQASNSRDAGKAQFFLGCYYHRKFYIEREKLLKEDVGALVEASAQFEDYVNRYAWQSNSPDWLSDAYFNMALIALQRGDSYKAENLLGKMYGAAPYDQKAYVYQVIWSPRSSDVIDASFDAKSLAEFTNGLVYSLRAKRLSRFEALVEKVKLWCKSQKTKG